MSFEVYVQCFKDGQPDVIPCKKIRDAFGSFLTEEGPFDWHLFYDKENSCDVIFGIDDEDKTMLQGFTVVRPCGDMRLWEALASILKLGNLVLFFPSGCPPLIGNSAIVRHIPQEMIELMGQPKCVTSGREILNILVTA